MIETLERHRLELLERLRKTWDLLAHSDLRSSDRPSQANSVYHRIFPSL